MTLLFQQQDRAAKTLLNIDTSGWYVVSPETDTRWSNAIEVSDPDFAKAVPIPAAIYNEALWVSVPLGTMVCPEAKSAGYASAEKIPYAYEDNALKVLFDLPEAGYKKAVRLNFRTNECVNDYRVVRLKKIKHGVQATFIGNTAEEKLPVSPNINYLVNVHLKKFLHSLLIIWEDAPIPDFATSISGTDYWATHVDTKINLEKLMQISGAVLIGKKHPMDVEYGGYK